MERGRKQERGGSVWLCLESGRASSWVSFETPSIAPDGESTVGADLAQLVGVILSRTNLNIGGSLLHLAGPGID
jgi:hypothetical protein